MRVLLEFEIFSLCSAATSPVSAKTRAGAAQQLLLVRRSAGLPDDADYDEFRRSQGRQPYFNYQLTGIAQFRWIVLGVALYVKRLRRRGASQRTGSQQPG